MGEIVNLADWRRKKAAEAYAKELEELAELREEVRLLMEELGEPVTGPYYISEDERGIMQRFTQTLLTALNGYDHWPIDSSDM